jgi:dedicated sortase system histidine kinase
VTAGSFSVSLRLKVVLLGLLTLALPWSGCRYAREMESVLREGERQALRAVAQTIATSLQGRTDLLYRTPPEENGERPTASGAPGAIGRFDLVPLPLAGAPLLDGFFDDWPDVKRAWRVLPSDDGDELGILAGTHERFLFLRVDVRDGRVLYDESDARVLEPEAAGDRIWIGFEQPDGVERQVFLSSIAPGALRARRVEVLEYGRRVAVEEPRIEAAWRQQARGYALEVRVPLSMIGRRMGVLVDDRDARGGEPSSYGSLEPEGLTAQGELIVSAPALGAYLRQFVQPGLELAAGMPDGRVLARVKAPPLATDLGAGNGILPALYRRFLGGGENVAVAPKVEPASLQSATLAGAAGGIVTTSITRTSDANRLVVAAAAPILDASGRRVIAILQVSQSADRWLLPRDRALTRLLNLTLLATSLAVIASFALAARLALRLARLRRASESALARDGTLDAAFPETEARDELGDVARSFAGLLARLAEYTGYLRTLAGKLAHEIRTPLTIVRSSLENLESEPLSTGARAYLERAREGSDRLNTILVAMGAASRVEEAIRGVERTRFDVDALLAGAVAAYATAFPQRRFAYEGPRAPCEMEGAPDLLAQMLDKLVDNAVDFSPVSSTIRVRLAPSTEEVVIEVENEGPPLPPAMRRRAFESLWQSRSGSDSRPHFGLGLYIVRLIAEAHGGSVAADNLLDRKGVVFTVRLARERRG